MGYFPAVSGDVSVGGSVPRGGGGGGGGRGGRQVPKAAGGEEGEEEEESAGGGFGSRRRRRGGAGGEGSKVRNSLTFIAGIFHQRTNIGDFNLNLHWRFLHCAFSHTFIGGKATSFCNF